MNYVCRYCLLLWALLSTQLLAAQVREDSLRFSWLGIQHGLPDANITCIEQDADGFLWVGTANGLSRYDGTEFKTFFHNRDQNSLPGNFISKIARLDTSHLVIATSTGLSLLNIHTLQFQNLILKSAPCIFSRENSFISLAVDANRNIWTGTRTALYCLSPELRIIKTFRGYTEKDCNQERMIYAGDLKILPGNEVLVLLEQKKKNNGLYYVYNPVTDTLQPLYQLIHHPFFPIGQHRDTYMDMDTKGNLYTIKPSNDSLIAFEQGTQQISYTRLSLRNSTQQPLKLNARIMDAGEQTLVCVFYTEGGFVLLPPSYNVQKKKELTLPLYFPNKVIHAVKMDRDGNLWLGTGDGLYKSVATSKTIQSLFINKHENAMGNLRRLSFIKDKIWLSTEAAGFFTLNRQFNTAENIALPQHPLLSTTWNVVQPHESDTVWLNTQYGTRWYEPHTKTSGTLAVKGKPAALDEAPITAAFKDSKGFIWLGIGFGNGVAQYNPANRTFIHYTAKEGLPIRYPLAIAEDAEGNVWMGNQDGAALACWKRKTNTFETITPDYSSAFDNAHVVALYCNRQKLVWIATSNGLFQYDITNRHFIKYTTDNGLPSNSITGITADDKSRLWIGTTNGLSCFIPHKNRFINFMQPNTLPEPGVNTVAYDEETKGIFFTTNHYINRFYPDTLLKQPSSLKMEITGVQISNKEQAILTAYDLPYNQNDISFSFTAINFADGRLNKYYYRLKGEEWITVGSQRQITFLNLSPGSYSFSLKAVNNSGIWSDKKTIIFYIARPWWQSWWFLTVALAGIAGLITWLVKRRIKSIRHIADMKQKMAETEMMALRAQMNPHFIFNCMNSIDALIQSNDKYNATVYLNKFAKLLRNILDSSKQNTVTLAKDLETLKLYIDLEKLRFENKFIAFIKADELLLQDDYKVPPLIVQPYVENAILHGLKNRIDNNGQLHITILRQPEYIEYVIEDNGVGREAFKNNTRKNNHSYGMQMSWDRVKFFNNENNASVVVTDMKKNGQATGTKVQIRLKIQ